MGLPKLVARRNPKYFRPQEEAAIQARTAELAREQMEHAAVSVESPVALPEALPALRPDYYTSGHHSFSGSEVKAVAFIGGGRFKEGVTPIELDTLTTISYSAFRDKYEVKAVGSSNVKGRTSGTRTVAGTMIFSHGSEHPLMQVLRTNHVRTTYAGSFYADEILPLDIGLTFLQSVSGPGGMQHVLSQLWLRGVEVNTESLTLSINQSLTEMPMQYVAHAVEYMHRVGEDLPGHRMERVQDAAAGPQSTETDAFSVVGKPMAATESGENSLDGSAVALDNRPSPLGGTLSWHDARREVGLLTPTTRAELARDAARQDPAAIAYMERQQRRLGHAGSAHTGPRPIEFASGAERAREAVRWNDEAIEYMTSHGPPPTPLEAATRLNPPLIPDITGGRVKIDDISRQEYRERWQSSRPWLDSLPERPPVAPTPVSAHTPPERSAPPDLMVDLLREGRRSSVTDKWDDTRRRRQ
jgi:hypothetical protein